MLDVGSGSGHFLDMLRHKLPDVDVTAYEFSAEIAALVQAKGVKAYTGMFPQVLHDSAADAGFDAICAFQVLEHVADPASFLRDLSRSAETQRHSPDFGFPISQARSGMPGWR